ncbi:metallophosphoesterase [Candidatus Saccharibacteria bacterium]|nr:metallophosphoesterase [Candidatus Saccharibacteria bacterium]
MSLKEPSTTRVRRVEIISEKKIKPKKILLTGDWHISPIVSEKQREILEKTIEREEPDLVLLQGDLIDNAELLRTEQFQNQLVETIRVCSKKATTVGVIGNHDQFERKKKIFGRESLVEYRARFDSGAEEILKKVIKEAGAKLLLDEWFEFEGINVFGFYQDVECCFYDRDKNRRFEKMSEKLKKLEQAGVLGKAGEFNWFLAHAPIERLVFMSELEKFDVFSFGHTHGGCVPRGLDKVFDRLRLHGGIVEPHGGLFPKDFMRGVKILPDGRTVIINSGMVATQFSAPRATWYLNFLKAAEVTVVEIKSKE